MRSLTWDQVCQHRLARQYLLERAQPSQVVEVVRAVCGAQAQIVTAAELTMGARVEGVTQQDVRDEIWERRRLVKTYGPRGTLHLLPADELPLWMAAMRARESLNEVQWYEAAGLEPEQAEALLSAIGEALDGRCLTREELAVEVSRRTGDWARERLASTWGEWLAPAAYTGLLCFGPSQGSKVTFVRADQWVGNWDEPDPQQALVEVLRRYLWAYGPATYQDFARWFWLKPEHSRNLMETVAGELEEVEVEGRVSYILARDLDSAPPTNVEPVRLLPQYDCYVLGAVPRDRLVSEAARKRISAHGRGRLEGAVGLPVLLINGEVAGMWERHVRSKQVDLKVEAFVPLSTLQRQQLEDEAARIGQFLGLNAALTLAPLG